MAGITAVQLAGPSPQQLLLVAASRPLHCRCCPASLQRATCHPFTPALPLLPPHRSSSFLRQGMDLAVGSRRSNTRTVRSSQAVASDSPSGDQDRPVTCTDRGTQTAASDRSAHRKRWPVTRHHVTRTGPSPEQRGRAQQQTQQAIHGKATRAQACHQHSCSGSGSRRLLSRPDSSDAALQRHHGSSPPQHPTGAATPAALASAVWPRSPVMKSLLLACLSAPWWCLQAMQSHSDQQAHEGHAARVEVSRSGRQASGCQRQHARPGGCTQKAHPLPLAASRCSCFSDTPLGCCCTCRGVVSTLQGQEGQLVRWKQKQAGRPPPAAWRQQQSVSAAAGGQRAIQISRQA